MGYNTRYELMYDAPSIYGLYVKRESSSEYLGRCKRVKELRTKLFGAVDMAAFRTLWFGEAGSDGTSRQYGNYTFSCDTNSWAYNSDMCDYVNAARDLANGLDFRAYSCPEDRLSKGECFDPCISMRYGQGFFPGGKAQNLFSYSAETSNNLGPLKNLRLIPNANFQNDTLIVKDEQSIIDGNIFFRAPINTPHAKVWRGLETIGMFNKMEGIVGISPCKDGGSDHCNYLTPTLHMDTSSTLIGNSTAFASSQGFAANIFQTYDTRGGD
jgi:hypothetical protein